MRTSLPPNVSARFDSSTAVFLTRELESIDLTDYVELFAGLIARTLIPPVENIDPLDLAYTYSMWSVQGEAKVGAPGANDDARITVSRKQKTIPIKEIPVEFGWNVDDIKRAAQRNIGLEKMTVQGAMTAVARKIDHMLAFGEKGTDCTGLLNNPDVDGTTTPTTKTGGGTAWTTAAKKSELLADIKLIVNAARNALNQASLGEGGANVPAFDKWVVVVPSLHFGLLDEPRSDNSDTTVIDMARRSQYIEDVVEWNLLDTADGGDPMIVAYPRNAMCLGAVVPRDWEQRPPQERGHEIIIPAIGSCGGTVIRYPIAVRYLKGV